MYFIVDIDYFYNVIEAKWRSVINALIIVINSYN